MSREKHISMAMFHWIKMYPMALICLSPLSGAMTASLPHVFDESWSPVVPNPILESQVPQSASLLPTMPILAFAWIWLLQITLNPSFLQPSWREPWEPRSDFHLAAPNDVERNCWSAIEEYKESADWFTAMKCTVCSPGIFMPRQIFEKGVSQ